MIAKLGIQKCSIFHTCPIYLCHLSADIHHSSIQIKISPSVHPSVKHYFKHLLKNH